MPPTGKLQSLHPLLVGLVVSGLAAGMGALVPEDAAGTVVGALFLGCTYFLCLRPGQDAKLHGLSLGGLLDPEPLSLPRLTQRALRALGLSTAVMAVIAPAYSVAFLFWFEPQLAFDFSEAFRLSRDGLPEGSFFDLLLGHLLVVALPEEAFFRGYLQSSLDRRWPPRLQVGGTAVGPALVASSAVFAVGHFLSLPHPARLAVFFPSLLFGWLRTRTGGIGASVITHGLCNMLVVVLMNGYGLSSTLPSQD